MSDTIKKNHEHIKENHEHIKENVHQDFEEKKKIKEEFREEVQKSKEEIKCAIGTAIDPNGDKQISLGEILGDMFSIKKDVATLEQIHCTLTGGGQVSGTNMCLLVCAIFIASIGLNMNSTAVIIGAMLISPLMGTIQATAYGTATGNMPLTVRSFMGFLVQVLISLMTSTVYFAISPISTTTSELLARTNPTIWDVLIATFGGLAGIIGVTRKEKTNVIPGVAIATALMPPLCTCGYSIAHGHWRMLLGAGYLFAVNCYFIFLSAAVILLILGVPRVKSLDPKRIRRFKISIARNTVIMIIPSLMVAYSMVVEANKDDSNITGFETIISVSELSKEMEVLFPEVSDVTVGEIGCVDDNGEDVIKNVIFLTIDQGSSDANKDQICEWLATRYEGYEVEFQ